MNGDRLLLKTRPSWWNFFWHLVFFWLVIPLIVALWKRASLTLQVTEERVILERGILNKEIKEIFITDIRTIDVKQTLGQRIFGIGDIMIATAGTSDYEDVARGLPNPKRIKDLIIAQRQKLTGS